MLLQPVGELKEVLHLLVVLLSSLHGGIYNLILIVLGPLQRKGCLKLIQVVLQGLLIADIRLSYLVLGLNGLKTVCGSLPADSMR